MIKSECLTSGIAIQTALFSSFTFGCRCLHSDDLPNTLWKIISRAGDIAFTEWGRRYGRMMDLLTRKGVANVTMRWYCLPAASGLIQVDVWCYAL